jgi:hypothetical protein
LPSIFPFHRNAFKSGFHFFAHETPTREGIPFLRQRNAYLHAFNAKKKKAIRHECALRLTFHVTLLKL